METKKLILPLFLAGLMILSVIGFALVYNDNPDRIKLGEYYFAQTDAGWMTYKDNQQIAISSDPRTLNMNSVPEVSLNEINSANRIYFTFNPEEGIQPYLGYFYTNLRPKFKNMILACTKDTPECSQLPLKSCEDASQSEIVIQIQEAVIPSISYQDNCLLVQGPKEELPKLIDSLILGLLLE